MIRGIAASLLLVSALVYLALRRMRQQMAKERDHAAQTAKLHLATMEALALAIEAKDHTAHNHIRRVQVYSTGLAKALDMSEVEMQAVETAAQADILRAMGCHTIQGHVFAQAMFEDEYLAWTRDAAGPSRVVA